MLALAGCAGSADEGPDPTASAASPGTYWTPAPGTTWQWQLSGTVDRSIDAQVYDIDGFENSADVVASLHAEGRKVICYVSAGAAEDFRSDHRKFPAAVLGKGLDGWPGERWLDVRRWDVPDLVNSFQFAVDEECSAYDECDELLPFVRAGKAVFHVEYAHAPCWKAIPAGFSSLRKNLELDAFVRPCTPRR